MEESLNHLDLERLAEETAAQAFGVGFKDLDSFITQQCVNREGAQMVQVLDVLLGRLSQHRNRLLRVELLPDEILLQVFKLAVDFEWLTDITRNTSTHPDLRVHYRNLGPIQRVNKRWHDIVVSYAPFWSLISTTMPKKMVEIALARARGATLCIGVRRDDGDESLGRFMDMVLPVSSRIGSLIIDLGWGGDEILAPLWTRIPTVQNLQIIDTEDIPYQNSDETCSTAGIPSPCWIRLSCSVPPPTPTLYAQVEELIIQDPPDILTLEFLKLIVSSAPRLRILRLDDLPDEDLDDEDPTDPIPMPNLQLLNILDSNNDMVGSILDCFQLSPSTSIRILSEDPDVTPYESQIRSQIWAALHITTESSFSLELIPSTYKLQTGKTLIEIEIECYDEYPRWPDFFEDFVPRAGQAPIRVYIENPGELPNEDCIKGLHSDSFAMT